ncbi:hypothetical protein ACKWTF_009983 [Chironomus riparius]
MDWQNWCRLCGSFEVLSKVDPEIIEIVKNLNILITENIKICMDCNDYLNDINQFIQKVKLMQNMFQELENLELLKEQDPANLLINQHSANYSYEKNINNIRNRFGLKVLEDKNQEILESLFQESNIVSGALDIKIENNLDLRIDDDSNTSSKDFDDNDEHEEMLEEEDEEELDMESEISTIEELSESKLYLKYDQVESEEYDEEKLSDLEQHLIKTKKRRKYRKSDEEKLFDFTCHICKQDFQKMCQLSSHTRKAHDCLPQVMCYCGKMLGTWKRLLIHKQKHFPEKFDYECKECKMVYKMKASYLNHMKQKHGPDAKKFVCHQCARCFKDSRTLMAHEKTHLPDELKLIFPCNICQKKFVNKNSLKSHITSVHEMASLYTCEQCGKSFSTKSNLKSHLYSHSTEKNVQCDICSARFKNMDSLRKHKKTHLEKSHECKICGNLYRNRNNLKAHMVCHSDDKPFKCTYCPNEYKRSKDLKCHMNLHSGERPFLCGFCSRSFVNGSNCRKHKLKDHPEELAAFEAVHGKGKAAVFALRSVKQT